MSSSNNIKSLLEKIAASLLKEETPISKEACNNLTEKDKNAILFGITDKSKIKERSELIDKLNKEKAWKTIIENEKKRSTRRKTVFWYSAAASIAILLSITLLLNKHGDSQNNTIIVANNNIKTGTDKAILTLEDGSDVMLEKGNSYQTPLVTSNGEEIIYLPGLVREKKKGDITYNMLTIPRGAQFQIKLSDGTQVWLNSESQLKYPVILNGGDTRQVELVYGEAYFDVSPSTDHNGAKFKVLNQSQEVEVLGTEFNIKAYKDETNIYTTLVEGKVAVNYSGKNQILAPNQQSNLNLENDNITISTVDAYNETLWKEGVFKFKRKSLKDIMVVLSRWYDMDVVFADKTLEDLRFIGTFNKSSSLEDILLVIENTDFIKGYEIHDRVLTIK